MIALCIILGVGLRLGVPYVLGLVPSVQIDQVLRQDAAASDAADWAISRTLKALRKADSSSKCKENTHL
jgi:hypothetical protein